jgi:O-antigen ligase
MLKNKILNHFNLYILGLILLVISLPVSLFGMSVSIFILLGNWLLERDFRNKLDTLMNRKSIAVFISIILVHVIWLFNTTDFHYAFNDIRIKLSLVALPLIIGTSRPLSSNQLKIILLFFVSSVFVATLISTVVLFGITGQPVTDIRDISVFISHIRFALMINVSIFFLGYLLLSKEYSLIQLEKVVYALVLIWLVLFLFLLRSKTGIGILLICFYIFFGLWISRIQNFMLKYLMIAVLLVIPLLSVAYITKSIAEFYKIEDINPEKIDKKTINGRTYHHDFKNRQLENSEYVWLYLCEEELRNEWNKISIYNYDSLDKRGQEVKYTLIRYLTSKGFRKDSAGISKLDKEDIKNVEEGLANFIYRNKTGLKPLIYNLIWQIDVYRKGGNPSGHSITQRIEYLKTAIQIIRSNFWLGVGTGDLQLSFDHQYELNDSQLSPRWRLRAHNQFITFFVAFGITGFIYCIFALVYPVFLEKKFKDYFFMMFFLIALLSMLNEDTLETHAGATFFSFFYSLFLFGQE